jgi:hypothetical protein
LLKPDVPNLPCLHPIGRPDQEDLPDPEAVFEEVRVRVHDHLTADPVRPRDPAYEKEIVGH